MKCVRCHRILRNPTSVINGMGPVCWSKFGGGSVVIVKDEYQPDMLDPDNAKFTTQETEGVHYEDHRRNAGYGH